MMPRLHSLLLLALMAALPLAAADDAGTGDPFAVSLFPRDVALGRAMAADGLGYAGMEANPALLDSQPGAQLGLAQAPGPFGASVSSLGLAWPTLHWGGLGLTGHWTSLDGIPGSDEQGQPTGSLSYSQWQAGLGWGRAIGWGLSAGLAGRWMGETLAGSSGQAAALDLGLAWQAGSALDGLQLGLVSHGLLGTSLQLGPGPADMQGPDWRLGAAWARPLWASSVDLRLLAQAEKAAWQQAAWGLGLELGVLQHLSLRAGFRAEGLAAGVGLKALGVGADYAWENGPLGGLNRFGLSLDFGAPMAQARADAAAADRKAMEAGMQPLLDAAREDALRLSAIDADRALKDERFKSLTYAQGLEAFSDGRMADARAAFEAVVKADPAYLKAAEYLQRAQQQGRMQAGGKARSSELQGQSLEAYRQGVALFLKGRYQEAIATWEGILERHPGQPLVLRNIEEARRRLLIQERKP
jgi:tetratricopeptide (TPR) repeat protein